MLKRTCLVVVFACYATDAWAYLDPGTGSLLLQGIVAVIATIIGSITLAWKRIRHALFGKNTPKPGMPPDSE